jgi:Flp pilus assembly protein TadG
MTTRTVFVTVMPYLLRTPRWIGSHPRVAADAQWHGGCSAPASRTRTRRMTRHPSRRRRRRFGDDTGTSLVEAAFITPLLLFLSFAIIDFALMFYVYLALGSGVAQASRYAMTGQVVSGESRESSIRTAMRNATPTLTIADDAFAFTHLPVGGATWVAGSGGPNDIGKITVDYTWTFYTPLVRPFFPNGEILLRVESSMKNERRFEE